MTQHPGLQSVEDLFGKLERELARLEADVTPDNYFNFVITAYHICDWVEKGPGASKPVLRELESFRGQLPIRVCRDIANGSKHFQLDDNYSNKVVADATCIVGFGVGAYGKGSYGVGELAVRITLENDVEHDGLVLARDAVRLWRSFLSKHDLIASAH